jgi:hypothetical protein
MHLQRATAGTFGRVAKTTKPLTRDAGRTPMATHRKRSATPVTAQSQELGYLGLLSLIVSHLPSDRTYTADVGRWTQSLKWLHDRHAESHPRLFKGLHFDEHPFAPPYSPQVSEFLTLMQQAGVAEVMNPGYKRLRLNGESQRAVANQIEPKVSARTAHILTQLASDLIEHQEALLLESS